jgi:hypothetical protein
MSEPPFKYDYGETVHVAASAPQPLIPGTEVAIVGMSQIVQPRKILGGIAAPGTVAYLIEFADGSSVEVPDTYVEPKSE